MTKPALSNRMNCHRPTPTTPARGGAIVLSPGKNFAINNAFRPLRMNRFSARRTQESGSSETRHKRPRIRPTAPAELIPDEVRRERRRECGTERKRQAHPPGSGERADAKKDGHGGDRKTDLLRQNETEEHHVAVLQ